MARPAKNKPKNPRYAAPGFPKCVDVLENGKAVLVNDAAEFRAWLGKNKDKAKAFEPKKKSTPAAKKK